VDATDAESVFVQLKGLIPLVSESLSLIESKKQGIDKLNIGNLVENDLKTLDVAIKAIQKAFIAAAPVRSLSLAFFYILQRLTWDI